MAQVAVQHSTPLRSENPGSLITNESGNIHVNQVYASVVEGQTSEDSRPPATLPSVPMQMQTTQAGLPQSQYAIPRSQSMPLPAPNQVATNGDLLGPVSKLESIKKWSISTYKCTKQIISERLGKSTRTVDTELETQIDYLRETQRKYLNLLRLARALASHFQQVVNTQHGLGEAMTDLAQKSPELQNEFLYNAETQRNLSRNGEVLLSALNFFVSSVNTLCNKTIEDTLLTVKRYETARVEYDAYRCDLEVLTQTPRSEVSSIALEEAQRKFDVHKLEFEKLRSDVSIKLQFLNENRVKVMHKQLLLFHNAISAYFSGNQTALDATLKQFNIKLKAPNAAGPSWIEQ